MRNLETIAEDIIKYLRQGGTASVAARKALTKGMKEILLDVNTMIQAGDSQAVIERAIRKETQTLKDEVAAVAIGIAVTVGNKEAKEIKKGLAAIAKVPQKKVKEVFITDAYIRKVLKAPLQTQNYSVQDGFDAMGVNLSRNTIATLRRSFEQGQTPVQVSKAFMAQLQTINVGKTAKQLDTVVRTAVSQIANSVRMDTYKRNPIVDRVMYIAILDDKTTAFCSVHDGNVYDVDEVMPSLPAHFNCRSTYIPVLVTDDIDDVINDLNKSRGGFNTYEDWLKAQPLKEQERILGKKANIVFVRLGRLDKALGIAVV